MKIAITLLNLLQNISLLPLLITMKIMAHHYPKLKNILSQNNEGFAINDNVGFDLGQFEYKPA